MDTQQQVQSYQAYLEDQQMAGDEVAVKRRRLRKLDIDSEQETAN